MEHPGIGGGLAVESLRFAVDDDAVLLDDDLGGESLRAVFARAPNYRTYSTACRSVPPKTRYDMTRKSTTPSYRWLEMGQNRPKTVRHAP
jgi:hypothetical protein